MSKVKRTPGEWFAGDSGTVYGNEGRTVVAYNIANDADCDLIAAAPELLEALKLARSALVTSAAVMGDFEAAKSPFIRDFDLLIDKAEGRTP